MSAMDNLCRAAELGFIRALDVHFARLIDGLSDGTPGAVLVAAALVSQQTGEGHVCLRLSEWADKVIFRDIPDLVTPPLEAWCALLSCCPAVSTMADKPLVLDGDTLYLARYWAFETRLAAALRTLAVREAGRVDRDLLSANLIRLLGDNADSAGQRRAAALAVLRCMAVISGGPGTGKTHTVAAILALLLVQEPSLRIALAAPTGKAAARLAEAIQAAKRTLPFDEAERASIPERTYTLHRLLGIVPGRLRPRYNAQNTLHIDLIVIDEASMVDLPLLAHVMDALPLHARLLLLGDRNQLASVEAGAVLADICGDASVSSYSPALSKLLGEITRTGENPMRTAAGSPVAIADSVITLTHSYRFAHDSGIGALASAVNAGDAEAAIAVLQSGWPDLYLEPSLSLERRLAKRMDAVLSDILDASSPAAALANLNRLRILCALREGPYGVVELNAQVERHLRRHFGVDTRRPWYRGRPVMVLGNDYALRLFNGDVGIVWPDAQGRLRVFFEAQQGGMRPIHPGRMPSHETVYAMTVHKCQGSEFDEVFLVLPRQDARVLTRELLYTGITRARSSMELCADLPIVAVAVRRSIRRASRLRERLWARP